MAQRRTSAVLAVAAVVGSFALSEPTRPQPAAAVAGDMPRAKEPPGSAGPPTHDPVVAAFEERKRQEAESIGISAAFEWTSIGPTPLPDGANPLSGRIQSIAVHPTDEDIVFAGAASGGLYRSTDGGASWTQLANDLPTQSFSEVEFAPSDPTIVYVGTGEDKLCINCFQGVGLYRIDGALSATPTFVGPINPGGTTFTNLAISSIVVHPTDPNIVFASTVIPGGGKGYRPLTTSSRGVWRSNNAAGALGSITFSRLNVPTGAASDSVQSCIMNPADSDELLCTVLDHTAGGTDGGVWRSVNALAIPATNVAFSQTLAIGDNLRSELAGMSGGGDWIVYEADAQSSGRVRRSNDGGATFGATIPAADGFCGGQCFYDLSVAVQSIDSSGNTFYLGGVTPFFVSTDGGATVTTPLGAAAMHVDTHVIAPAPSNPSIIYQGNDGGVWKSGDAGGNWFSVNASTVGGGSIDAIQYIGLDVSPSDLFLTIGGTQDNGTHIRTDATTWTLVDHSDGGKALIDHSMLDAKFFHTFQTSPYGPNIHRADSPADALASAWNRYGCTGNGFGFLDADFDCSDDTEFYPPIALGPGIPPTVYYGTDVLYRSADQSVNNAVVSQNPVTATETITAIGVAPLSDAVRLVGLSDGRVFRTTTGSSSLVDVTNAAWLDDVFGVAPVPTTIAVDPFDSDTAYVAFANYYGPATPSHIWKTTNLSDATPTWVEAGAGIPNNPIDSFLINPQNSDDLFAGTENVGVYRSVDGGATWGPLGTGLPAVPVYEMKITNPGTPSAILRVATHGRGMWEVPLAPTAAGFASASVSRDARGALVEWTTAWESDTLAFHVWRDDGSGRRRVTAAPLAGTSLSLGPGTDSGTERSYAWRDPGGGDASRWWIEEIDLRGGSAWHGPYASTRVSATSPAPSAATLDDFVAATGAGGIMPRTAALPVLETAANGPAGRASVKALVSREGWYRVPLSEVPGAGSVHLFSEGRELPVRTVADAAEFYGIGLDAPWTAERVYWLWRDATPGRTITVAGNATASGAQPQSFPAVVERRDRSVYFSSLRNGEAENFFGAPVTAAGSEQALAVTAYAGGPATVDVSLQGVTLRRHEVAVSINGVDAGEIVFDRQSRGSRSFTVSSLRDGENLIRLRSAEPLDVSLTDAIRITYQRHFVADRDELRFTAQAGATVNVAGFTTGAITVADVTDPDRVTLLRPTVTGTTARVVVPGTGTRLLYAFAAPAVSRPPLRVNAPSSLRSRTNLGSYLAITTADLAVPARRLAERRALQGYFPTVVDIEDVFDEFAWGERNPAALRAFLEHAAATWLVGPRAVVLIGDGSMDPRNHIGRGSGDLIPVHMHDIATMETATDGWFADFDDDGAPDIAIGRLPVATAAAAGALVDKVLAAKPPSPSALLVTDRSDTADFAAADASLAAALPPAFAVERIDRDATPGARSALLAAIDAGQAVVNYTGHGSIGLWRGGLLTADDAPAMRNPAPSLFVLMTCLNGYFVDPGVPSLAESLLWAPGGAAAVWASTGTTEPAGQLEINIAFYRELFGGRSATLGQAAMRALQATTDPSVRRSWNLLGDPASMIGFVR